MRVGFVGLNAAVSPLLPTPTVPDAQEDDPDDTGRARRQEWGKLLKRVFAIDVLECARCTGPMRMISFVDDERTPRKILTHLGLPTRAPPRGRAQPRRGQLELDGPTDYVGVDPPLVID